MKGVRLIAVVALITACLSCGGGYSVAYRLGHKAELKKDWDTALVNYEKARNADPANSLYIIHEKLARVNASALHTRTGNQMLKDGREEEAAGEFQKAVRIDPTNIAAEQQLDILLRKQAEAKKTHTEALQKALKKREEAVEPQAVKLQPLPQEPLAHFKLTATAAGSLRPGKTLGPERCLHAGLPSFAPGGRLERGQDRRRSAARGHAKQVVLESRHPQHHPHHSR